jgi:hypothetical protein
MIDFLERLTKKLKNEEKPRVCKFNPCGGRIASKCTRKRRRNP